VDFDFVQNLDLAELQRSGKIKRSKSISTSALAGGDGRGRNDRRSTATSLSTSKAFRSRLVGSMSLARSSRNVANNIDVDDDREDQSVAAAVAALTLDPDLAREALHFSSSRHDLFGPGETAQDGHRHSHSHSHRISVADGGGGGGGADNMLGADAGPEDERDVGRLAAVCMAVGVGSLSDPAELNGMAHFLEHMLSMGSEEFPLENDFESFLSRNGGRYNAFTESEETVFFFEIREDALEKALEMFASFFVAPLLRLESAQREINAVQSELSLLMNNDDFRISQIWRETTKEGTPYQNFNVGSTATLQPLLTDLTPMREFYERFYTATNMKLTVFTTDDSSSFSSSGITAAAGVSSAIHDTIIRVFSGIAGEAPSKPADPTRPHTAQTNFSAFGMPWENPSEELGIRLVDVDVDGEDELSGHSSGTLYSPGSRPDANGTAIGCVYRIVALHAGTHRMRFSFPLPPKKRMQDEDVHHYVSYIIGHESKGGILAELKAKGWATYLAAGVGDGGQTSTTGYRVFVVQVRRDLVWCFQYIFIHHGIVIHFYSIL
jgi:hypothetical protein